MSGTGSGARWLIPIGLLLAAGGVAALIGTGNEDVVNWLRENSTCNERPCTYDEAKDILTGVGALGTGSGALMTVIGIWRALRGRDAGPTLSLPDQGGRRTEPEPTGEGAGFDSGYGFPDRSPGNSPSERLARLDALLASGRIERADYLKLRERILREI